jgi:hypothetical protein
VVEAEAERDGGRIVRIATHHSQQCGPRRYTIRVDGYGKLVNIG